eukprot:1763593-Prymnesium_polylepis.1
MAAPAAVPPRTHAACQAAFPEHERYLKKRFNYFDQRVAAAVSRNKSSLPCRPYAPLVRMQVCAPPKGAASTEPLNVSSELFGASLDYAHMFKAYLLTEAFLQERAAAAAAVAVAVAVARHCLHPVITRAHVHTAAAVLSVVC